MPERASSLSFSATRVEFRGVEAGREFVHQQQPRAGRERAGEIEHFLMRAVEFACLLFGAVGEVERSQQRAGIGRAVAIAAITDRDLDILAHRQREKRPRHLESTVDAGMHETMRREPADFAAFEPDGAAVRPVQPGNDVDARGFARPVRSDQAEYFAGSRR